MADEKACAECERLREEIADYMGHRTDNAAGKLWAAQLQMSWLRGRLEELIGDFDRTSTDDYDQSLEIHGAATDARLGLEAQQLIRDAGFHQVWLNHGERRENCWETHYTFGARDLPVRGWRKRISGDHCEISYWPEGWNTERSKADLASGYYRIVPDPLDPLVA